jgi:hypothetical protein
MDDGKQEVIPNQKARCGEVAPLSTYLCSNVQVPVTGILEVSHALAVLGLPNRLPPTVPTGLLFFPSFLSLCLSPAFHKEISRRIA